MPVPTSIYPAEPVRWKGNHVGRSRMNLVITARASVGLGCCGTRDRLDDPVLATEVLDIAQAI